MWSSLVKLFTKVLWMKVLWGPFLSFHPVNVFQFLKTYGAKTGRRVSFLSPLWFRGTLKFSGDSKLSSFFYGDFRLSSLTLILVRGVDRFCGVPRPIWVIATRIVPCPNRFRGRHTFHMSHFSESGKSPFKPSIQDTLQKSLILNWGNRICLINKSVDVWCKSE